MTAEELAWQFAVMGVRFEVGCAPDSFPLKGKLRLHNGTAGGLWIEACDTTTNAVCHKLKGILLEMSHP